MSNGDGVKRRTADKAEALRAEVAAVEEQQILEAEIAQHEARLRELRGEVKAAQTRAALAEVMPEIPAASIPSEVGDVLDEAMLILAQMPAGGGAARLQRLMQDEKPEAVRDLLREAAIRGKYAEDLDGLVAMDFSKLPRNSLGVVRGVGAIRRNLLGRMIFDANKIAASGLVGAGR